MQADPDEITLNVLCAGWQIYQLRKGHRWNTDDLLVAWTAQRAVPGARRLLDLGSGVGSIGLLALRKLSPEATLTAVEAQEVSAGLARRTLEHNGLTGRARVFHRDLREIGDLHLGAFDLITANPPYLPPEASVRPRHEQRAYARIELRGDVFDYCRVAAAHLAPGGWLCLCHAARDPRPAAAIAAAGLALRRVQPVVFRAGKEPTIALYAASWSGPCVEEAPLFIQDSGGKWTLPFQDIRAEMGLARLILPRALR